MPDSATGRTWRIGLYAPAGFATEPAAVERAVARLTAAGHRVTIDPTCSTRWQRFSATDDERLAAVMRMAEDPDVELAIAQTIRPTVPSCHGTLRWRAAPMPVITPTR
jgi:muramoyltetrapeptide carboxypeptidase LdcA involved in peptidoglycan recycling